MNIFRSRFIDTTTTRAQVIPTWHKYVKYIYFFLLFVYLFAKRASGASEEINQGAEKPVTRYQVATFNFDHVSDIYAITLWILLGSLSKVGFQLSHKLTEKFPESCLLIILGLVVGGLLYATKLAEQKAYVLNSDTFFLFLLPPIILEAGYFMPNRPFFDNIGTILLFAIANTLFNTIMIGLTLWGFSFTPLYGDVEFEMLHCFVFAALISAVDPVAVLATFVEIHVNDMLYIVVFGESLLNDAVSVVLYRMFDGFSSMGQENILGVDLGLGLLSFIVTAFGGVLIGIIFGILASFTTKFTEHTPILEPLIILTYSYLAYLTAEMFSTSGILAITFCGMFMKQYVEYNISKKSNATIEYVFKMLASIMETIIFMFMGLSTISDNHSWNTGFVVITLISCTVYRILGVVIFANIANHWRLLELTTTDMLIMSYGGIRGAVAFALALILDESKIPRKKEFVTATIAVVFFTVFVQGTTIGPLVKLFKVKIKEEETPTMSAKLTNRLVDHIMSCLEEIAGVSGKHSLRDKVRHYDKKILKPFLLREKIFSKDDKLLSDFKKINESNIDKIAKDFNYVLPSSASMAQLNMGRNLSIGNFLASGLSEISTVPDFTILGVQPSKRAEDDAQFHHLLDNAMYDPRKKQAIHKRSQLNEDQLRKRRNVSTGQHFHHQNPIALHSLIDMQLQGDQKTKKTQSTRIKRPGSNVTNVSIKPRSVSAESAKTTVKPLVITPLNNGTSSKLEDLKKKFASSNEHEKNEESPPMPSSPLIDDPNNIPPPWKLSNLDSNTDIDAPLKAHMPAWANNPGTFATTTKPDESQHRTVFELFGNSIPENNDDKDVKKTNTQL